MVRTFENVRRGVKIELDNGTYLATIKEIGDGEYKDQTTGATTPQYTVDFVLDEVENEDGSPIQLRYWLSIPQGLVDLGVVSPQSKLYSFLKAMGEDPDAEVYSVNPNRWVGNKARVVVENKAAKSGANAGVERPVIVNVWPPATQGGKVKAKAATPTAPSEDAPF